MSKGHHHKQKSLLGFEQKHQPLLSRAAFGGRLFRCFAMASGLIAVSLFLGMLGYHLFEEMSWIDAFANASMILSGMGPLEPLKTWGGKLFAGMYALYSGLLVIITAGIILAPILHRLMHRMCCEF